MFQYAKIQLLFNIHEQEIIDRPEVADQRISMLKLLEFKTRELLIQIQKCEDLSQQDYISCGPLTFSESREDRFQLIYRSRFMLSQMSLALGLNTRAYFILKQGLVVI